ncbi:hypothetical protein MSUIS_04900 [Mycoplasma suis KI3806]|uniref:Uncharacterized protein n=1 Tax=Mycoplasma suis (strain KI_3806) TaxID=708248 RepID=F0V1Q2_MYCS3|nr:hypothetical protein [Mycoplasma suis]CBZ40583.1 hypothetical protein MSUIS_04900 [Mycoplasma suis KI3806]
MIKKMLAICTGVTGIFGLSIEKHLNIFSSSSSDILNPPPSGGGGIKSFLKHCKSMSEETLRIKEYLKKIKEVFKISDFTNENIKAKEQVLLFI